MLDLIVRGGTVVTASETFQADIGVTDEKISHIAEAGSLDGLIGEHTRVIDAGGKYVMPGLIEPHMHVKAPFSNTIEMLDFYTASKMCIRDRVWITQKSKKQLRIMKKT